MRIFAILVGIILLLPGLCSIIVPLYFMTQGEGGGLVGIFAVGVLFTWLGVWIIFKARDPK